MLLSMQAFLLRHRALLQSLAGLAIIFVAAVLLSPTDMRTGEVIFLKIDNLTNMLNRIRWQIPFELFLFLL